MGSRLELHAEFLSLCPNVYFQPPSNFKMTYPCIVYNKTDKLRRYASNGIYEVKQEYRVTVIDRNPDSTIADEVEKKLPYCGIDQYYTVDNLNHTSASVYY